MAAEINDVICYPGVVSPTMCDRIVALGNRLDFETASVVGPSDKLNTAEQRRGDVSFFPQEDPYQFIVDGVSYFTNKANDEAWRFELFGLLPLQYSIYRAGHFFDWHRDTLSAPSDPNRPGPPPVRKLSFSLQLSEADSYEGGDFQMQREDGSLDKGLWRQMRQRGSFIIFPAVVVHRVTPVIMGERRSLVGWVLGAPTDVDNRYDIPVR